MELNGLSRRGAWLLVLACALLALALRSCALGAFLPCEVEPDGLVLPGQVELIQRGAPDRDSVIVWRMYPHLISELAALIPPRVPRDASLAEHLAQASAPIVHVRIVVALLSLLAVPATYALARRFLGRGPAVLAAFLSAASLLSLLFAQQARPHAAAAAIALLAVVAALRLARRPSWGSASVAALAVGLSIGALQSGLLSALPLAAAWLWRDRRDSSASFRRLAPPWMLLLAGAIAWLLTPHSMPGSGTGGESTSFGGLVFTSDPGDPRLAQGAGHNIQLDRFDGGGFLVIARTLGSFETVPFLFALAALCLGARAMAARRSGDPVRRDLLVAAAYVVPYVLVFGMFGATVERFSLQLVPFVACLAAAAWARIAARSSRALAVACLGLLALPSLGACLALQRLRLRPDGVQQLAATVASRVAPETERVLFLPGVDVPLARTKAALEADAGASFSTAWTIYQRAHADETWDCPRYLLAHAPLLRAPAFAAALEDPLAAVRETGAKLVALATPTRDRAQDFAVKLAAAFQRALAQAGTLECRTPAGARDPLEHATLGYNVKIGNTVWTWELLAGLSALGTGCELYRLP